MRPPPLARIAAVAAPRPDAEPVTIAHTPSFDIAVSSPASDLRSISIPCGWMAANFLENLAARKTILRSAELAATRRMPPCSARRLSGDALFLIMHCQEQDRARLTAQRAGRT